MTKKSAGLLMYRSHNGLLQVLLVHPGGPYWARKQWQAWSIPKGEIDPGEDAFAAAKREFEEETGLVPDGRFWPLQPVKQGGGKLVYAWCFQGDCDPQPQPSTTFEMEWPPRSGQLQQFPEVDEVRWFSLTEARRRIIKAQNMFLDELVDFLHHPIKPLDYAASRSDPGDDRTAPA